MFKSPSIWLSRAALLGAVAGGGLAAAWLALPPRAPGLRFLAALGMAAAGHALGAGVASARRHRNDLRYILRLREELRLSQDNMMEYATFRSLGAYLDATAGKVREPLEALSGAARSVAADPSLSEAARQAAARLRERADEVRAILGPLATYSITKPSRAPFGINDLLRAAIDLCRHRAEEKTIRFEERYAGVPPVFGPATRIQQALLNVVINAVEAMPFGGGTIAVETRADGDRVVASVRDAGIGIRPEQLPRIFDPFFTTKPESKGVGLGLWATRETMEMIGGAIGVRSVPHQGTEVTLTFPQAAPVRAGRAGTVNPPELGRNTADEVDRRIA